MPPKRRSNRINFVTAGELLSFPKPDPLIEGHISEEEAVCLYGEPNGGKSFLALDWALCVATGKPWLDTFEVKQGPVIYMAGEGGASLQLRVEAWMKYHKIPEIPGAYFQLRPLPLRDEEIIEEIQTELAEFAEEQVGAADAELQPRLVVVDTLSQFMMGGDENGPDMALFVANCRRLSHDNKTAILIVHHTNKGGAAERGHTSLRGNVDVMFRCSPVYQDHLLVGIDLMNDKQRDNPRAASEHLKIKVVDLGIDKCNQSMSSLVVVPTKEEKNTLPTVNSGLMVILEAMLDLEDLVTEKVYNKQIVDHTGMLRGTVHKRLDRLAEMGLVKHREGKSALTTLGRAVLDAAGKKRAEPEVEEDE